MSSAMAVRPSKGPMGLYYGWWTVIAAMIMLAWGWAVYAYGIAVFIPVWAKEFGWSFAAIGFAFTLNAIEGSLEAPVVGWILDKWGPRLATLGGFTLGGLGFIVIGAFMNDIWFLYLFYPTFVAVPMNAALYNPAFKAFMVAFWKRRGLTIGLVTVTSVFTAGPVSVPIVQLAVNALGWRSVFIIVGVGNLIIMWLAMFYRKHPPQHFGLYPDGADAPPQPIVTAAGVESVEYEYNWTLRKAVLTAGFWGLALFQFFYYVSTYALQTQGVNWLRAEIGMSSVAAAALFGWAFGFSIPGRLLVTFAFDRMRRPELLAVLFCALAAVGGVFMILAKDQNTAILAVVLFGIGGGGAYNPLGPALTGRYFGRTSFAWIYGWIVPFSLPASLGGPVIAGWVFDTYKSYQLYWIYGTVAVAIGGVVALTLMRRPVPPVEAPAAAPQVGGGS